MSFTSVLVFGKYVGVDDSPATGSLSLTLSDPISDGSAIITPQTATAVLDAAGTAAIVWPANDDATTEPVGTSTRIAPSLGNAKYEAFSGIISHSGLATLLTGRGAPSSETGSNGNWYLDTAGGLVYGPKVAGAWPTHGTVVTNLHGQTPAGVVNLASVKPALSDSAAYSAVLTSGGSVIVVPPGAPGLTIQFARGSSGAGLHLVDAFGNPIGGVGSTGGFKISGDRVQAAPQVLGPFISLDGTSNPPPILMPTPEYGAGNRMWFFTGTPAESWIAGITRVNDLGYNMATGQWMTCTVSGAGKSAGTWVNGFGVKRVTAVTSAYTVLGTDSTIFASAGPYDVTLPTAVGVKGQEYLIKNTGASGTITLAATGGQNIDFAMTRALTSGQKSRVQSDNVQWWTV